MPKDQMTLEDVNTHLDKSLPGLVATAVKAAMETPAKDVSRDPPIEAVRGASIIRQRKFTIKDSDKGIAAARMIRCLAFGRGDTARAKYFAEKAFNDDLGDEIIKALNASDPTAGGSLMIPEYAAEIIELLLAATVVRAAGARTLPMNNGQLTIRKTVTGSAAGYVGESQDIGVTQPGTGQIDLSSKKLACIVPISNDLLTFTSGPSADQFVRDDLVMEMALREDRAFLRDDGTNATPKGMRYWALPANVTATNGTTSANIESDFKDLLNALEGKNVRLLRPAWFMHPSRKNFLRNLRDANGNLIYPELRGLAPGDLPNSFQRSTGTLYGYPVFVTTSVPANLGAGTDTEIMFADMVDAIIGEATTLEIEVDRSASYVEGGTMKSAFSRDETLVRAIARHDFAMRHAESVAVKTGVQWGQ